MKVVFLLANKNLNQISTEAATYDDILAGDFLDSFHNLTFKDSMLMTWAKEKCPSKFIFKGDDDILLNPYGKGLNMNNIGGLKIRNETFFSDPQIFFSQIKE